MLSLSFRRTTIFPRLFVGERARCLRSLIQSSSSIVRHSLIYSSVSLSAYISISIHPQVRVRRMPSSVLAARWRIHSSPLFFGSHESCALLLGFKPSEVSNASSLFDPKKTLMETRSKSTRQTALFGFLSSLFVPSVLCYLFLAVQLTRKRQLCRKVHNQLLLTILAFSFLQVCGPSYYLTFLLPLPRSIGDQRTAIGSVPFVHGSFSQSIRRVLQVLVSTRLCPRWHYSYAHVLRFR